MPGDFVEKIVGVDYAATMEQSYLDYAMSVIVSRAIPDVRDGLKPVQRRILYAMNDLGFTHSKPHFKSAKTVGEVMASYHPHGNEAIYMAMVHMAQKWALRYTLIDGQGNFGSIDGDGPAAMRYTESRMSSIASEMLADIDKETINWTLNFDETLKEPTVLPSKLPNLLVNGTSGIAVGMATNMAPHNLCEICDGIIAYIDNNDITVEELMRFIPAPDFPTGAIICGTSGIVEAYNTGRGRVVIRSKTEIEEDDADGKARIVVTEIPFMVNKSAVVEKIAELTAEGRINGISDIRDETNKEGIRIVIDLKKDAIPQVVLNNLFANTELQSTFNINNVCLVKGRPMTLGLKDLIKNFYEHRHEIIIRRTQHDLRQAKERIHILEGYIIALNNIDAIINLIKTSANSAEAMERLYNNFGIDDIQAKAILDMRLQKLTGLEREKVENEHRELNELAIKLEEILRSDDLVKSIIKDELTNLKERYGDERRTQIEEEINSLTIKDITPDEDVVITLSHQGYIKRTLLSDYKLQNRGGVGSKGSGIKDNDYIEYLTVSSTHKFLLAFTIKGELYWKNVYELPKGEKGSKGRAIQNVFPIRPDDKLACVLDGWDLKDKEYINNHYIIFCTKKGFVKKTSLREYSNPRSSGIHGIKIKDGDELLDVKITDGTQEIILATRQGKAVRFYEDSVNATGRNTTGVKGIRIKGEDNEVVGMVTIDSSEAKTKTLLVVSEAGYGKRTLLGEYNRTKRGCIGVKTMNITKKTGKLIAIESVNNTDELLLINNLGIAIRISVNSIQTSSRNTQGVILKSLHANEKIKSIAKIVDIENGDEEE